MNFICADIIPKIVSYIPLEDLRIISKGSCLFDIEICRQGIRVVYDGNKCTDLRVKDRIVIKLDDGTIQIMDKPNKNEDDEELYIDYVCLYNSSDVILQPICISDKISPINLIAIFDGKNDIYGHSWQGFAITKILSYTMVTRPIEEEERWEISRYMIDKNGDFIEKMYITFLDGTEIEIPYFCFVKDRSEETLFDGGNVYMDIDSKILLRSNNNLLYSRFSIVYINDDWAT